jgi:hypothetical protein
MASLFDPELDPSMIEGGGVPLDLPQPAKTSGSKWKELAPLLAILPIALKRGGRVGGAALLQGFQQAQQQREQQSRQEAIDAEQRSYRDRQLSSLDDQRRATAESAELQRRQQFLTQFGSGLDGLDTPEAVQAYLALQAVQGDALGVPRAQLEAMAPAPTVLQQKAAKKRLADLDTQFGAKLMEMGPQFTYSLPGEPQPVSFDELLRRAGQSKDPNFVAPPSAKTDKRGFTPKDITLNGTRMTANYDPDTGQYYAVGDTTTPLAGTILEYQKPTGGTGGDGGPKPLTHTQRAQIISGRRKEWERVTKVIDDRKFAIAKVDAGLAALSRGDRISATQTIITAFNKLQDETSVVREGEYARSEELAPFLTRIEASLTKLVYGGGKLTDPQLASLAQEAKNIANGLARVSERTARDKRQAITEELTDYQIPLSRVFGGSTVGRPLADPGGIR